MWEGELEEFFDKTDESVANTQKFLEKRDALIDSHLDDDHSIGSALESLKDAMRGSQMYDGDSLKQFFMEMDRTFQDPDQEFSEKRKLSGRKKGLKRSLSSRTKNIERAFSTKQKKKKKISLSRKKSLPEPRESLNFVVPDVEGYYYMRDLGISSNSLFKMLTSVFHQASSLAEHESYLIKDRIVVLIKNWLSWNIEDFKDLDLVNSLNSFLSEIKSISKINEILSQDVFFTWSKAMLHYTNCEKLASDQEVLIIKRAIDCIR